MSLATGHETKSHYQACGIATNTSPNAESRRAVWARTMAVPDGTGQAGNIGPQAAAAAEGSAVGVSCVGNIVPHKVEEIKKKIESAQYGSSFHAGSRGPVRGQRRRREPLVWITKYRTRSLRPQWYGWSKISIISSTVCPVVKGGRCHLEALPEVSALLNLDALSTKDFKAEWKAGEIAEIVLLKPETSPENLNFSYEFKKQRATRLGSVILKYLEEPVYPLVKEFSDVASKHPPY
ncbi:Pol protein [Phytophthora palmivora]|uniref:Pol protein n=1 Tax=Phytophthora palmivora TaxID=4796 RepID=A0A2P4XMI8_9STRA|nr:Pol protein [Phytophthora palmivora]